MMAQRHTGVASTVSLWVNKPLPLAKTRSVEPSAVSRLVALCQGRAVTCEEWLVLYRCEVGDSQGRGCHRRHANIHTVA
jgi:hypothetical protein